MALRDLIRSLGLTGDAKAVTAALNAKTVTRTDSAAATYNLLAAKLGAAAVGRLDAALKASQAEWARASLAGGGLDLSMPAVRAVLDSAAGQSLAREDADAVKALGVRSISPYEAWAGEGQVAAEGAVAAALQPPVIDGHTVQLCTSLSPTAFGLTVGVYQVEHGQQGALVAHFATAALDNPRLSETQREFVRSVHRLLSEYEVPK